ncbi:MAG: type II secretion system protein E [Geobacteraceae bacterium GWC2_58_44]|nr:MAG: type II secretion system protein E [Geobacteraceae bacterium GWC2_58_44]HBG06089.1 type II secretion system protein E [Geobacter sp.]
MDIVLVMKTGEQKKGFLAGTFRCETNEIHVVMEHEEQPQVLSLDEICCVLLKKPAWDASARILEPTQEVEILSGERYLVRVRSNQDFDNGFFGLSVDEDFPYRTIFFTFAGIRARDQKRKLGQILREAGALSQDCLDEVLETQEDLRSRRLGGIISESAMVPQHLIEETLQRSVQADYAKQSPRVGDILVDAGLVTHEQVEAAPLTQAAGKGIRVGELLIMRGLITEQQLLTALATRFAMRMVDLDDITPGEQTLNVLSEGTVRRMQVFPVHVDGKNIVIATSDPADFAIGDTLRFITNCNIELVVAPREQISEAIERYYGNGQSEIGSLGALIGEMEDGYVEMEDETDQSQFMESDSKVISLITKILTDAHRQGASDVHLEPGCGTNPFTIRYRMDGECQVVHKVPYTYKNAIISRIKILANLDITEQRKPQSGKILLKYRGQRLEYRVEITPTIGSQEDAVLRLLSASKPLSLEQMHLSSFNVDGLKELVSKPHGIILCVGPTGSGKTTTIHSALKQINLPQKKIWTVEDPVEIIQEGLRQVQVNQKINFSFKEALRSFLRADPDVIMIGEMRDPETAKIAIEASLTGHLVFSTLHTNSAAETVVRLIDMGMDPFNFADALLGVLAQRLVRKLCDDCKKPHPASRAQYDNLVRQYGPDQFLAHRMPPYSEELHFMKSAGCESCAGTGYKGRLPLHEFMIASADIKEKIKSRASLESVKEAALGNGMRTLMMDGIAKVFVGLTDFEQVSKACMQ